MKKLAINSAMIFTGALLVGSLCPATVSAQDHSGHVMPMPEAETEHTMSHETVPAPASGVRDPHGYSGGYERNRGPYALPESQQLGMADEAIFFGFWTDRFETRTGDAENFQEFSGNAWMGNSYHRLVLKSDLERRRSTIEESSTELMYSRAISPFWDLQMGGRYDHGDIAHRKWLAVGLKGLAPYWFEIDATAYLGEGHSSLSVEMEYDLLLTQRLILQPKFGLDFYGDSDLEAGHAKGLSKSKMGVRLRYEITRQFAPYVGYERIHHHGDATDIFRAFNQHRENQWLAGLRFWF